MLNQGPAPKCKGSCNHHLFSRRKFLAMTEEYFFNNCFQRNKLAALADK